MRRMCRRSSTSSRRAISSAPTWTFGISMFQADSSTGLSRSGKSMRLLYVMLCLVHAHHGEETRSAEAYECEAYESTLRLADLLPTEDRSDERRRTDAISVHQQEFEAKV